MFCVCSVCVCYVCVCVMCVCVMCVCVLCVCCMCVCVISVSYVCVFCVCYVCVLCVCVLCVLCVCCVRVLCVCSVCVMCVCCVRVLCVCVMCVCYVYVLCVCVCCMCVVCVCVISVSYMCSVFETQLYLHLLMTVDYFSPYSTDMPVQYITYSMYFTLNYDLHLSQLSKDSSVSKINCDPTIHSRACSVQASPTGALVAHQSVARLYTVCVVSSGFRQPLSKQVYTTSHNSVYSQS